MKRINLELKENDPNEPQDAALNELVDLNKRERNYLRGIIQRDMEKKIESANLYFDNFIEEKRRELNMKLDILYKISKSSKKFDEEIKNIDCDTV
ncbi:hypothetical protein LCGC14_0454130 [marine sediment metagenome]|uniref:Uncharacterized protein n=1 Tax=marine sediment metagenome TaxID=412755 RepID=A0A0F9VQW5_9ZZZZ